LPDPDKWVEDPRFESMIKPYGIELVRDAYDKIANSAKLPNIVG
jgi:hypothetical protein